MTTSVSTIRFTCPHIAWGFTPASAVILFSIPRSEGGADPWESLPESAILPLPYLRVVLRGSLLPPLLDLVSVQRCGTGASIRACGLGLRGRVSFAFCCNMIPWRHHTTSRHRRDGYP